MVALFHPVGERIRASTVHPGNQVMDELRMPRGVARGRNSGGVGWFGAAGV